MRTSKWSQRDNYKEESYNISSHSLALFILLIIFQFISLLLLNFKKKVKKIFKKFK